MSSIKGKKLFVWAMAEWSIIPRSSDFISCLCEPGLIKLTTYCSENKFKILPLKLYAKHI